MKQDDSVEIIKRATEGIIRARKLVDSRFGIGPGKLQMSDRAVSKQLLELRDDELLALLNTMEGEF